MSIAAIIAEYNPFHTGHKYQIEEIRKRTGVDHILIVMSGNFVQRGCPAIIDKYTRTRMALLCGADLVIELPVFYSSASAKDFAYGAVNLLHKCGIVDYLCFGAETDNLDFLNSIADILIDEPPLFTETLKDNLSKGFSYAESRMQAILDCLPSNQLQDAHKILSLPNSILGIEYLKALKKFSSTIKPIIIERQSSYHSLSLTQQFASASGIRNAILDHKSDYTSYIPPECMNYYTSSNVHSVTEDDYSDYLNYSLIMNTNNQDIYDVSSFLYNSICNNFYKNMTFTELSCKISGKHTTLTHCNRALLHTILNITNSEISDYISNGYNSYIRILGFRKDHIDILTELKSHSSIPMISKLADSPNILDDNSLRMLNRNIQCDDLYRITVNKKYNADIIKNEYQIPIVIV